MIQLKYKHINNTLFVKTVKSLVEVKGLGIKTAYTISKIAYKLDQEMKHASELYNKLLKKYAKLDENGNIIPNTKTVKDGETEKVVIVPGSFDIPEEKQADFMKEADEFMEISFDLPYNKLSLEDLEGSGLSAAELSIISDLINPLESVK